jgi:hypothetical protein
VLRDRADRDVAVGDHPDEPVIFADRQDAAIELGHELGRVTDALPGVAHAHVARHCVADSHGSPFTTVKRGTRNACSSDGGRGFSGHGA